MNKLESWLNRTYKPNPQPWKRKVLFWVSVVLLLIVSIAGYLQYTLQYSGKGVLLLLGLFGFLGGTGFLVSLLGNDFWVAMILGRAGKS